MKTFYFISLLFIFVFSFHTHGIGKSTIKNRSVVYGDSCKADFIYTVISSRTIQFRDTSTGNIINRTWDFGDGQTSSQINPTHLFNQPGIYTVSLSIETIDSCRNSTTKIISISLSQLHGVVTAGKSLLPKGKVYLFSLDSMRQKLLQDTCFSIESGHFNIPLFSNSSPQIISVVPELDLPENHYPEYFPTYYGDEKYWKDAGVIVAGLNDTIEINLLKRDSIFYGHGVIKGSVDAGQFIGTDLNGACILLLNLDHQPLMYTFVDENDSFVLNHIPYGTYYLLIDKVGIPDKLHEVTINSSVSSKVVNLTINENTTTSIERELTNNNTISIYPNPFCNFITVNFNNRPEGNVPIKIMNCLGQNIQISHIAISDDKLELDLSHLPNGIYLIKILDQTFRLQKIE
jgi:PKD repeat protein